MRTETEIREAYGYLRDAYDSAKADGNEAEAKMLSIKEIGDGNE